MKKIITLGPSGTYAEIASQKFNIDLSLSSLIEMENTIDQVFKKAYLGDYLVLPFDNSIDGYVQRTLDLLYESNYYITHVNELSIDFSLISNENSLENIKNVYVQFKAHAQCYNFLKNFSHFNYITTDSNTESLNRFTASPNESCTIIPTHLISSNFELIIHHVHDTLDNKTRFVLLENKLNIPDFEVIKAYVVLSPNIDQPGLLHDILYSFKMLNINLTSIISRPKKNTSGKYNFFIELSFLRENYNDLINELEKNKNFSTKILGVYK
ncbi:prephenate dehydratase [Acholeplasma hippikon]|nr:prephenate dehydratase domain-containing protein [Acholeplasma hippikon]